ncbi:Cyclin-J-like protein [Fukomys damarensis]|uniref:Cyclin-J-like protein n=1 Tax=Fukomys damarensis TaxID=885580 RepID=A0A091EFN2_FUKDA|nr:Cyclin-J-like protein [Fukomys damarensis]
MMDEPWWEGRVASDVHCTLREKELKLPAFRAHSPLLKSRRFFVDVLTLLSSHCRLCPAARHLAIYLLDHFMDRYNITTSKQLYTAAVSCLLLATASPQDKVSFLPGLFFLSSPSRGQSRGSRVPGVHTFALLFLQLQPWFRATLVDSCKFEDREDHVPKLEQINSARILSSQNFSLSKRELLSTELLLLEAFGWNLCLPTPAHFLDYYLLASVSQKDHHCHTWPTTCPRKTKECLKEYAHYFLEVTLQDHIFYKFRPSVTAAACVGASRICLQLSPCWTTELQRISNYSLEHLSACIEILLVAYDSVLKDAIAVKSQALAMVPGTPPTPSQVLLHLPAYTALGQPTATLAQLQAPVQDLCLAYRDSLQAHHSGSLLSAGTGLPLHSPYPTLQPVDVCPVPLPASLSMHMAIAAEPRHCLAATYRSSYFSGGHLFPAGCFDR